MDCSLQSLADWIAIGRFNSQRQVSSWELSRSVVIETSSYKTTPRKLIAKQHEFISKKGRPFHWFTTKKSSRSWKPTLHGNISNCKSARHQNLGKENCNELQIVSRSRRYEDQESKIDKNHHSEQQQLSTKFIESHQRFGLVGSDARWKLW